MKFFTSLRGQLTLAFLAVLALGLGLLLLLAANQMSRMTLESFTHEQQVLALIMANTLPMPLDEVHTQETLTLWTSQNTQWRDDLSSNTTISVYNLNGALVATSTDAAALYTPVSADLRAAASGEIVSKIAGDEVYVIVPILHDGRILLGTIALESPLEPVMDRLRSEWLALGGAAGLAMLLAVLAAVWLSARLTQPLSELRTAAERMADGHLDYRVRVGKSVREVASLGDMFNHMAEQVEAMI
ncbi:MAG TPA: HAMP domain-containing protein, partial [Aggregatilineales bacterium]|nr:HAMP domain-containing protein [Aggregatilineales bacterium]